VKSILQFTADGAAGGGTTLVLSLVESLLGSGWKVTLLTESNSYAEERGRALGADVITAPFMGSRTDPSLVEAVNGAVAKVQPDIVHLHGTRAAYFGRKLQHPAVAATVHGYHFLRKSWFGRMAGLYGARQSFGAIRDLIFVADYDRRVGEQLKLIPPGARAHVIHNGIELPVVAPVERDPQLIAFPHRLSPQKDPATALYTLSLLPKYSMEVAGKGELDEVVREIKRLNKLENLTLRGGLSREETLDLMARAGCVLMTSKWEGLPIVILEAMALGTPVVAPAICGIPEIITDGEDGILVESHAALAYAAGIRRLADEELRAKIVANAQERVREHFTWQTCFARHLEVYESRLAA